MVYKSWQMVKKFKSYTQNISVETVSAVSNFQRYRDETPVCSRLFSRTEAAQLETGQGRSGRERNGQSRAERRPQQ